MVIDHKIENGIVICCYPRGIYLSLDVSKKMVEARLKLQKGKDYPVVIYANGLKYATAKARKYLAKEGVFGLKAGAFIVNTSVERMLVNFFFSANAPSIPSKVFSKSEEAEALKWISQYK